MSHGMSDGAASEGGPTDIELIDPTISPGAPTPAPERSTTVARRPGVALATLLLVGGGLAALASTGPGTVPPPTTAPTTTPTTAPAPTEPPSFDRGPTAFVGDSPRIVWQSVEFDVNAGPFRWVSGGFFSTTPEGARLIEPGFPGPNYKTFTGFDASAYAVSSETVAVENSADGVDLLFLAPGQPSIRLDVSQPVDTDLVTVRTSYSAERLGEQVVVLVETRAELDVEAFRQRVALESEVIFGLDVDPTQIMVSTPTGSDAVPIDPDVLSADDLAGLRLINNPPRQVLAGPLEGTASAIDADLEGANWIAVVGDEFLVGGSRLWRSADGVEWERATTDMPVFSGITRPGPDGLVNGLVFEADTGFFTSSADAGRTWQRSARVLDDTWQTVTSGPIVAMTGWPSGPARAIAPERILTPTHELVIDQGRQRFELFDRSGSILASGGLDDPRSGLVFVPGAGAIDIIDPQTGELLASIDLRRSGRSIVATRTTSGDPQRIAVADLRRNADGLQEWTMAPITEVFGEGALAVDLTAGRGWLLADVLTETGRAVFVAEVPPPT